MVEQKLIISIVVLDAKGLKSKNTSSKDLLANT